MLIIFTRYVIAQIPHGIIIQKTQPQIWLPSMMALWAGLTMCTAPCKMYEQMCVVRFFQGMAEASTYYGTMYVMGSWQAGSMFSGAMMTAVHQSMDGYAGLPGWKWVFLIAMPCLDPLRQQLRSFTFCFGIRCTNYRSSADQSRTKCFRACCTWVLDEAMSDAVSRSLVSWMKSSSSWRLMA
ncbi:hypothetical protein SLS58_003204 [Diplodia intermedia]|uniref:Pantothenate transporter liz1 n=1 Tax=Diplodia intermedia TaxID=856260 RepID=A0ABR3TXH4_9PEZI